MAHVTFSPPGWLRFRIRFVLKIMDPFWFSIILRHLIFRGTDMEPQFWERPKCTIPIGTEVVQKSCWKNSGPYSHQSIAARTC